MVGERGRVQARPRGPAHSSFETFYEEHWSRAVAVTAALCRDVAVAEEITQEAFLRAYRRWRQVSVLDRPELWVRRVALNLAVSRFRRLRAETKALARSMVRPPVADEWMSSPQVEALWDALRRLPSRQGQVAVLFYLDDLRIVEIAELLGLAEGTVKAHLHAARQRLRDLLDATVEDL